MTEPIQTLIIVSSIALFGPIAIYLWISLVDWLVGLLIEKQTLYYKMELEQRKLEHWKELHK